MTNKELIQILVRLNPDAKILTEKGDDNGCSTCGWGETSTSYDLSEVNDLENKIVLVFND